MENNYDYITPEFGEGLKSSILRLEDRIRRYRWDADEAAIMLSRVGGFKDHLGMGKRAFFGEVRNAFYQNMLVFRLIRYWSIFPWRIDIG